MAQNRSASSRVPPSASTCRTHIRTVNFMPVINGGGSAEGGSTEVTAGSAPLAARSAIRPLTWSGDIDAGNCNTTVAPAGSAAHPTGVTQSRSSSPKARDRAAITEYLSGFASITSLLGRTRGRSGIGAEETAPAETVMDAFYQKPEPSGQRWRVQATTSALERAQLFGSDIQAPHSRAAERFRATGG